MLAPFGLRSAGCLGLLFLAAGLGLAQGGGSVELSSDRISPIVRVVQKCQGAVVGFVGLETGKLNGTCVVVDPRGLIVTNAHVVGKAKRWGVRLIDKSEFIGDVLTVTKGDLALVRANTSQKLDALPPCPSDEVFVGETVIAIGHPYGYSYTISRGILSATGRQIPLGDGSAVTDAYQVDAAINPGNSGGPLMNINGELIGINFAVRDGANNIAFTIPAKRVREVLGSMSN